MLQLIIISVSGVIMFPHDIFLFAYKTSELAGPSIFSCIIGIILLWVLPLWLLCRKLGLNPWLSLLLFVPIANICIFWILYIIVDKRRKY